MTITSYLYCSLIPCFHVYPLFSSGSLKSLHLLRGKNSNNTEVFTIKKLVTFGTPLLSASFSLFLTDRSALDMEYSRPFFYHSPAVELSPDPSAVTFPLLFRSQFSPILSYFYFPSCWPGCADPSPQTQSSQYSQQPVVFFCCYTQWIK